MSYDPRTGTSPYLGMDADDTGERRSDAPQGAATDGVPATERTMVAEAAPAPATVRRTRRVASSRPDLPSNAPAQPLRRRQAPVAVESPRQQDPFEPARPAASRRFRPLARLAPFGLRLAALILRLAAIVLAGLVVASAVAPGSYRAVLVEVMGQFSWLVNLPLISGRFVSETPFGGVLRGDLMVASVVLFVCDWACLRLSASLRDNERRS